MAFTNPIVGGTVLIREAIESPDYVPGVSGWAIKRDGSAEFNDVTMRGSLIVDGEVLLTGSNALIVEDPGGGPMYSLAPNAGVHNGIPYPDGLTFQTRFAPYTGPMEISTQYFAEEQGAARRAGIRSTNLIDDDHVNPGPGLLRFSHSPSTGNAVLQAPSYNFSTADDLAGIVAEGTSANGVARPRLTLHATNLEFVHENSNLRYQFTDEATNIAFSNTSFTSGTLCGFSFEAGKTGAGVLKWHARLSSNTAETALVSARVGTGSVIGFGTTVLASSVNFSVEASGNSRAQGLMERPVSGLTPGATYNIVTQHMMNGGGNGEIFHRSIWWVTAL